MSFTHTVGGKWGSCWNCQGRVAVDGSAPRMGGSSQYTPGRCTKCGQEWRVCRWSVIHRYEQMADVFYDPRPITDEELRSVGAVNACGPVDNGRSCRDVAS